MRARIVIGSVIVLGAALLPALAQSAIDWHTIDGGGGTRTDGPFTVSGTIGQPEAGPSMAGGAYTLTGDFRSLVAVQTPGAPLLTIEPAGPGQATVSWEPDDPGWILQQATDLVSSNRVNSASGSTNPVTVPAGVPTTLHRLYRP